MNGRILTLEEWVKKETNIDTIYDGNPIIDFLFPDATLQYMNDNPQLGLSPSKVVFFEAEHKFKSRYVMYKYNETEVESIIDTIKNDILSFSMTEWNRFVAMKQIINGEVSIDKLHEIFGNYSITKVGGWSDDYKGEDYEIVDTWTRETGETVSVSNFESTRKELTNTTTEYAPNSTNTTSHQRFRDDEKPSTSHRKYDGGGVSGQSNYKEYGMKNGEFYNTFNKFILSFPNAVDMFLNSTASAYLLDLYNPVWLCE